VTLNARRHDLVDVPTISERRPQLVPRDPRWAARRMLVIAEAQKVQTAPGRSAARRLAA
jgi:hypothetical protein